MQEPGARLFTEDAQEMQKGRWSVLGGWALSSWREPSENALFEFLRRSADCAAVIGVRDFPENCVGITEVDLTGVANRDVAIDLTVNEEDWN